MTVFQGLIFGSTSEAQNSFVSPFKSCLLQAVHSDYNGCDSVQNWTAFVLWHFQFLSLCFHSGEYLVPDCKSSGWEAVE